MGERERKREGRYRNIWKGQKKGQWLVWNLERGRRILEGFNS